MLPFRSSTEHLFIQQSQPYALPPSSPSASSSADTGRKDPLRQRFNEWLHAAGASVTSSSPTPYDDLYLAAVDESKSSSVFELERSMRLHTDMQDVSALERDLAEATAMGMSEQHSAALRTARLVHDCLKQKQQGHAPGTIKESAADAAQQTQPWPPHPIPTPPATSVPVTTPPHPSTAGPGDTVTLTAPFPTKSDSDAEGRNVNINANATTPQVKEDLVIGRPHRYSWWSNPPAELAGLLPDESAAAIYESAQTDTPEIIQKRFNGIVNLAGPDYHPSRFPIGIIGYNRPQLLQQSLDSLLSVPGVNVSQVTLYQDGTNVEVAAVARKMGVRVKQHLHKHAKGEEGAAAIARHYRWTLSSLFDDHPQAEFAIVVEDDMLFAKDFMSFFVQTAPLYKKDPSIYCITSWNDNGQRGLSLDPRVLLRTDFFIGLGWMVSRAIYKDELERRWPATQWDHWLRKDTQRKNRQCIYPEVARNYNIGKLGTHSYDSLFKRYFEGIVLNQQPAVWLGSIDRMIDSAYESSILSSLSTAIQLSSPTSISHYRYTALVLFLDLLNANDDRWTRVYAPYFGLWELVPNIRGMYHDGVMLIRWKTNYVYLVANWVQKFARFRRPTTMLLTAPRTEKTDPCRGNFVWRKLCQAATAVKKIFTG